MSLKKESRVIACIISVFMLSMTLFMGCARQKTITMAWLPNNSGDNEKAMRAEFGKIIMNATGYKVVDKLTTDYNIAMAALESGDAQLGYFGPFEYITGHARNSNIVALIVESGNSGTLREIHVRKNLFHQQHCRKEDFLRFNKFYIRIQHARSGNP
ncbi:MAG: PhnD/SsuA/transferrin family substrate-binding protein [Brevinematales bacterium]